MLSSIVSSELARVDARSTDWLLDAGRAFATRLALEPLLLLVLRPLHLTDAIKRNPRFSRAGWEPYDSYHNAFTPFEASRAQRYGLAQLVRCMSALARAAHAWQAESEREQRRVCAWAVGDLLGDTAALLLEGRRVGGVRRVAVAGNVVALLFYLHALWARRTLVASRVQLASALSTLWPLGWYRFTLQRGAARWAALGNATGAAAGVAALGSLLAAQRDPVSRATLGGAIVVALLRIRVMLKIAAKKVAV